MLYCVIMVKDENEERLFYRYQKIDECTKDNLKNNVLYFNDPEKFNDPFDSEIDITHQGTKEDWSNFLLRYKTNTNVIDQWIRDKKIKREKNILILNRTKINHDGRFIVDAKLLTIFFPVG